MNIDYEAIEKDIRINGGWAISLHAIKAVIEAYEAQKNAPEWVPLDLEKVKQGQEVRQKLWPPECGTRFVAQFEGNIVIEQRSIMSMYSVKGNDWLMRAPKPKTVRVRVMRRGNTEYVAMHCLSPPEGYEVVGEGDIEVTP